MLIKTNSKLKNAVVGMTREKTDLFNNVMLGLYSANYKTGGLRP